ncbi:related to oxidoreductase [Lecanosticta acicola]|uniref:Related to oxidoreductase n=1 Tax=Lecanosticta acicola TaxID=111012 RepID=A0AAI9E8B8_9PEZI|nr:related to oxidoreductase [Lecanosticta acicola]
MAVPVPDSTLPFWRTDLDELDTHRSTEQLPTEADIVVIGAGYAGASIVHHLLEKARSSPKKPSIAILEAREACSGATGRNGGHLKPDPFYRAAGALKRYGKEAAEEVAAFEVRQVEEIKALVEKEQIDCDFVVTRATDVSLYDDVHRELKRGLDELGEAGISTASQVFYSGEKTAEGVSGVKGAKACFTYTAAHVWPYKLVLHLLKKAISQGVNLQTQTPVQSITKGEQTRARRWTVHTSRGSIHASHVIHATNAYASALLPEYKDRIVPVRGICSRIVTRQAHPPLLSNSYLLRLAPGEYDYLIPRTDGSIIVGGARRDYFRDLSQWYDVSDDSKLIEPAKHYFDGYMQRHFRGWEDSGAETDQVWTGIMGYSSDGYPHVGPVPGKDGQFICGGFTGHGMPQIFLSAKAIASMVLDGKSVEAVDLPRLYRTSRARLDSTRNTTLESWEALPPREIGSKL